MGKGSRQRRESKPGAYASNWDRIFSGKQQSKNQATESLESDSCSGARAEPAKEDK